MLPAYGVTPPFRIASGNGPAVDVACTTPQVIFYIESGRILYCNGSAIEEKSYANTSHPTPKICFRDSDTTDGDLNACIAINCTTTGSGAEDCDLTLQQQIGGTLTDVMTFDADGIMSSTTDINIAQATLLDPDNLPFTDINILQIDDAWAPNGITITRVAIATSPSSSYTATFEEWDDPVGTTQTTIEAVSTSTSTEAEVEGGSIDDQNIATNSYVNVLLPATDIDSLQVIMEFTIND